MMMMMRMIIMTCPNASHCAEPLDAEPADKQGRGVRGGVGERTSAEKST
jgi:hypothetical protein